MAEIVDRLEETDLLRRVLAWFNGPAMAELGTDPASVPSRLPDRVDFDLGVIAGDVATADALARVARTFGPRLSSRGSTALSPRSFGSCSVVAAMG